MKNTWATGWRPALLLTFGWLAAARAGADTGEITVRGDAPGVAVSPTLYGAFFEDINRAGDGGLYGELVQNRSFEDYPAGPLAWTPLENPQAKFALSLDRTHPLKREQPDQSEAGRLRASAAGGWASSIRVSKEFRPRQSHPT